MAGRTHILLTILLIISVGYSVEGSWWDWEWDWSASRPANCPHEDEETHICSSISSANGTCISIRCCTEDDESEDEYSEGMESEYDAADYDYGHHRHGGRHCNRLCVSVRGCTVYKCRRYCCDGYTTDWLGRCLNKTSSIDCQNGGTPYKTYEIWTDDEWACFCPRNFTGSHCETPICHCENGGQCQCGWSGQTHCQCRHGFTGRNCSQRVCTLDCENGGSCMVDGNQEMCTCPYNYVGKLCEDYHVNDRQCPVQDSSLMESRDCRDECSDNYDCDGNQVCCKEGCSTVCRHPKDATCEYANRIYAAGANITTQDPCLNCTCFSSGEVICARSMCVDTCGAGEHLKNGQCCPKCADNPQRRPPVFDNCPTRPANVTADYGSHKADLTDLARNLVARDYMGRTLGVAITPAYLSHCKCPESWKHATQVVAKATDMYESSAECRFDVYVQDREPPRFESCPDDIYVFEEEVVTWQEPTYTDNVGIYKTKCNKKNKGTTYPVGVHTISYTVIDFEYNIAVCDFQVTSTSRDTDFEKMPEGMRQRATDKGVHVAVIVAPVAGLLIVIIALVLMFFCCRRRRLEQSTTRQSRESRRQQYDNNIYAICGPTPSVKCPPYSLPSNPPAYSSDMKEGEYAYIAPPSYKEADTKGKDSYENPAYDITLDNKQNVEK